MSVLRRALLARAALTPLRSRSAATAGGEGGGADARDPIAMTAPRRVDGGTRSTRIKWGYTPGTSNVKARGRTIDESDDVTVNVDALTSAAEVETLRLSDRFPDENILETAFGGVRFKDLPLVTIVCAPHNTKLSVYDQATGNRIFYSSPRMYGFDNAAKRTNVAAQIAGSGMGQQLRGAGHRTARVRVDGFNNGRIAAMKGIALAGISIVSISDVTHIDWAWARRAKKRRRVR